MGTDAANPTLTGQAAFAIAIDPVTGEAYVAQYLSLHQDSLTNTPNDLVSLAAGSVGVTVTLTDGDGDQVTSAAGDISTYINFLDDGPTAPTLAATAATIGVDETPGVQTRGGASDVLGSSAINFNGAATTVAGLFSTVANKGADTDVPVASLDNGALSFASSGASSIVSLTGGVFGADGPGTTSSALSVTNAASGLTLTDGTAITLSVNGSGVVVGTVEADAAHPGFTGQVAFAIALDPLTGQVYVAQYLSLHQDNLSNTPNDLLSLAAGSVAVTVTLTDGDGDQVSSAAADIGTHINFLDDGPTAPTVTVSAATVGVDETPAVQTAGGASDVLGSSAINFNGAATTVAGLFSTVANKGTDPDVPAASLDNGALSFASSGASSIVSVTGGAFGADGPGTTSSALSVTNAASGLTLTDGTAITLSLVGGQIIGTVGADAANPSLTGKVAFAIALDPLTGQVYVAQYLSLHQDSLASTPNDLLSLAAGSVGVTVTLTDGDGDQVSSTADIGTHINFLDDGPTAPTVTVSAATVGVDETPAVQTVGGASDVLGSSAINFNGAATTVAGLFSTVANKGTDPDVPAASLDNGALSFASSGASSIVTLTGGAFGADGPGTTSSALSVTNAASGLTLTDGTAITLSLVGGQIIGTVGADAANPSLTGKVAFAIALDPLTGQVYVAQYLSLHQDSLASTPNDLLSLAAGSVGVTVTLTDGDGDQVSSTADIGTHINFLDDGPTAPTVTVSAATVGVDETPAVQTTGGASDVLGSTAINFNGAATTVAGLFSAVANKGTDPDVPAGSLDNGALSFASSGASSIVSVTGGAFGADGPGTTTSALSVTNAASGLTLTDGTAITLSLVGGQIIGTVGADAANPSLTGKVAFAIALDPLTGQVYVAQYLSLHQDSLANTPNDLLSLAAGTVGVTVTLTDGDGDQASSTADIGTHINFLDDGPTAPTVTVSAATAGVDETPAVQTTGGASDVLGSTAITFNGAATTVAGLFAGVLNKGTDPDVPAGSLDNGALSFASSGASSIVTLARGAFGADGPFGGTPATGTSSALSVTNAASGLTLTDGTAITLSLVGGQIIGTVGADAANPSLTGKVAFAIALDPLTGQVYVAQYLSLHQDSATNTPNDLLSLAAGSVAVTVTLTDGDGDQVSSAADIGTHINFLDDGPTNISPLAVSLLNGSGSATASLDIVDTNTDNN